MKEKYRKLLFRLIPAEGILSALWMILDGSERKNALFFGLSGVRMVMLSMVLGLTVGTLFLLRSDSCKWRNAAALLGLFLCASSSVLILFGSLPQDDTSSLISLLNQRALPFLIFCAVLGLEIWLSGQNPSAPAVFSAFVMSYAFCAMEYDKTNWSVHFYGTLSVSVCMIATAWLWQSIRKIKPDSFAMDSLCGIVFCMVLGYGVIRFTSLWMGRGNTPSKAYWNELAEAFLNGRMYLIKPSGTHDLTQYKGKWFVPNPPLPAILLMPVVALLGSAEAVNMVIYSAVLGGINAGLIFFTLRTADRKGLFPLSIQSSLWVTLCITFGTDHFWLATTGQMWFISQLLTVTFTLLSVLCVLWNRPAALSGLCLGLGILSRPNIFTVYLCLVGLYLWKQDTFPHLDFKNLILWGLKSGIPILVCVFILLGYNKLRFDDWMDFGYVTINGADWILESVQQYGMFHPHFIKTNLNTMLFGLPRLDFSGQRFFFYPYVAGYSIFLMTPALIYTFRNLKRNWWIIGSWASVLLTTALLVCYHNNGAEQVGFRYLLDATAPLTLLIGNGTKNRISPLFKLLTGFAIILAFVSIYWWYLGRA